MPFIYPATEIFNALGERRVVWSQDEYELVMEGGGFTDAPPIALSPIALSGQDLPPAPDAASVPHSDCSGASLDPLMRTENPAQHAKKKAGR